MTPKSEMNPASFRDERPGLGFSRMKYCWSLANGNSDGPNPGSGHAGKAINVIPLLEMVVARRTNLGRIGDESGGQNQFLKVLEYINDDETVQSAAAGWLKMMR